MKKCLNSNVLKLIAIIAMTVDHITWAVFPGYHAEILPMVLHIIGRITCPIMCFFIAEGFYYSKDIKKYTTRLFVFAVISHFAYIFASNNFVDWKSFIPFYYGDILNQTSVMWSLAWGLVMLRVEKSQKIKKVWIKMLLILLVCVVSFPSDWSCIASLCVLAIGLNRNDLKKQMIWMTVFVAIYSIVYLFSIDLVYGIMQMGVVLSVPFLMMYNGKRGENPKLNKIMKWFFYIYYPLHLFIIGVIKFVF